MKKEHKQSIKDCIDSMKELNKVEIFDAIKAKEAYQETFTDETSEELKEYVTALIVGYKKLLKK
jgi:uncharacterized protein YjgD (DUF1641 family)